MLEEVFKQEYLEGIKKMGAFTSFPLLRTRPQRENFQG